MRRKQFSSSIRSRIREHLERRYEDEKRISEKQVIFPAEEDCPEEVFTESLSGYKDLEYEIVYYQDTFELVTKLMELSRVQLKKAVL